MKWGDLHPALVGTGRQRVALMAAHSSAVVEEDCSLDRQKQNSNGERSPLRRKEGGVRSCETLEWVR